MKTEDAEGLKEALRKLKEPERKKHKEASDAMTDFLIAGGVERKLAEELPEGEKKTVFVISAIFILGAIAFFIWFVVALNQCERATMDVVNEVLR